VEFRNPGSLLTYHQIWDSLGLDVTSIESGPNDDRAFSWAVSLDYNEQKTTPEKVRLHKLSPELPYHDTKPPLGVHAIRVEAFHVKMLLKKSSTTAPCKPGPTKHKGVDRDCNSTAFDGESLFHNHDLDITDDQSPCFDIDAESYDADRSQYLSVPSESHGRQVCSIPLADGSCAYLTPPPSQEKEEDKREESVVVQSQHDPNHVYAKTLLSSLETGIRHITCKLPNRKSRTNVVVTNEDFKSLDMIAPALWVPGYHQSLSERALFIPTISHAIAKVSGHGSAKLGLRVKAWQLSHRYPHLGKGIFSTSVTARTNEVQEALSASLWTEMTAGLHDIGAAKRSQPFRNAFEFPGEVDASRHMEDMLDETAMDCGSEGTSFDESDFENLLDEASDAEDYESTYNWSVSDIGDMRDSWSTEALRLPDRWNSEHPSRLDPEGGLVVDSSKLGESDHCDVLWSEDGGDRGDRGSHREIGQRRDGSGGDHDSTSLLCPDMEYGESDVEDMLLWDWGDVGAGNPSGQAGLQHRF
jgi:hypothetical protein